MERLPERMHLPAHGDQHGAEGGLMHGRQQHAEGDEDEEHLVQRPDQPLGADLFQQRGGELDAEHQDVGGDTEADLQHHRIEVHVPGGEDVVELPVAAHVDHGADAAQAVAEQAGEQGGAHQRMVLALVHHIDGDGQGVAAAGKGGAHHHVVDHPDAPGVAAVEVGDYAHAVDEALGQVVGADQGDDGERQEGQGEYRPFEGLICTHESSPPSSSVLRRTT
ncbi:MAG: hypothetical protein AB2610_03295 [Candidatus Thiodiazotropha sp.]